MKLLCTGLIMYCFSLLTSLKVGEKNLFLPSSDSLKLKSDTVLLRNKADTIVEFAKTFVGTKYLYGSCSPQKGFDCSGFVYYVYLQNGITLPRSSYEMGRLGKQIQLSECKRGDVILFRGTNAKNPRIGHAGLIISDKGEPVRFVHSSSNTKKGGVIISNYDESSYYAKRFVKVVRFLKE